MCWCGNKDKNGGNIKGSVSVSLKQHSELLNRADRAVQKWAFQTTTSD